MAITTIQFKTLSDLFDYYNEELFNNGLPDCLVNLSRHKGAHGFFAADRWKDANSKREIDEISLNPDTINRPDKAWHSTLVHEMVHLWQQKFGKPSRTCYHNKQWAGKMEEVGLIPSATGEPGGKKIGQRMTHYIQEGGQFERAFNQISKGDLKNLKLNYLPNIKYISREGTEGEEGSEGEGEGEEETKNGVKIKYTCLCNTNVWGKPGLKITCGVCKEEFAAQEKRRRKASFG